jgi:hypothetical protein
MAASGLNAHLGTVLSVAQYAMLNLGGYNTV